MNYLPEIEEGIKNINKEEASTEVLNWVINNVENFIDNQVKHFKLDLIIEENSNESLPNLKKIQDLYMIFPEKIGELDLSDNEKEKLQDNIASCIDKLENVTKDILNIMKTNENLLGQLFEKLSYYYELKGINKGQLLTEELTGSVDITEFFYDDTKLPMKVRERKPPTEEYPEGELVTTQEFEIPAGFSVWIEISLMPIMKSSIF